MVGPAGLLALLLAASGDGWVEATDLVSEVQPAAFHMNMPSHHTADPGISSFSQQKAVPIDDSPMASMFDRLARRTMFQDNANPFEEEEITPLAPPAPAPPVAPPAPRDPGYDDGFEPEGPAPPPPLPEPPSLLPLQPDVTGDVFPGAPLGESRVPAYGDSRAPAYGDSCGSTCDASCDAGCGGSLGLFGGRGCDTCDRCGGCVSCMFTPKHPLCCGIYYQGWIEGGSTINTDRPANGRNFPVGFNDYANGYQLNQVYFVLAREVNQCCRWDIGGRVDMLYGTDARFTSARGLEVRGDLEPKWNSEDYGLSMPQAYMEVYAPWGNGVTVKVGHFYTILGYETVPAIDNFFYSHSYAMLYGEPFTHTGFLASTPVGGFNLHGGMTRGWDNWEDNNNDFGFLGGIDWTSRDGRTTIALAVHLGREQDEPPVNTSFRNMFSLVLSHQFCDGWQYVAQYDHGFDPEGNFRGGEASWYGLNSYFFKDLTPCLKGGLRFEWFRDEDGVRIDPRRGADYFELTLGLNWQVTQKLLVRPEFRWDWTDTPSARPYVDGTRNDQILMACDVIWQF